MQRKPWLGGYVRETPKGRSFIIDKWVGGRHFHKSTRCSSERAALKQLERFEADPYGYSPLGDDRAPLVISVALVKEYRAWCLSKQNSLAWVNDKVRLLGYWADDLAGRDIRDLSLQRDLKAVLDRRQTSRRARTETIKDFCAWLREEKGLLTAADDRTLDLAVPVAVAAKNRRRRAIQRGWVGLVLPHLSSGAQDVLLLQSGTAWHISEVRRFAKAGEIVRPPEKLLAVLVTRHKSGELTRTPLDTPEHVAAAERILKAGSIPRADVLASEMKEACETVRRKQESDGVPEEERMAHWRLGVMRHSVLTWAVEMGATPEQASQFANHRSVATTKKFYIDLAVPTVSVPVLRVIRPNNPESATG